MFDQGLQKAVPWRIRSRIVAFSLSMVSSMIAVGESTGALDAMLVKIADFYDDEVDQAVKVTAMIEPFMMVFSPDW